MTEHGFDLADYAKNGDPYGQATATAQEADQA